MRSRPPDRSSESEGPSWLLSGTAPILLQGPPPLDTLPRCSALSWGWLYACRSCLKGFEDEDERRVRRGLTGSPECLAPERPFPSSAESSYPPFVLLLDILADVVSDTLAGERLFAALRRQFVDDGRKTSLDVRLALERRRKREAAARKLSPSQPSAPSTRGRPRTGQRAG